MSESRYLTGVRLAQLEFQTATMRRHLRLAVWLNVGLALALAAAAALASAAAAAASASVLMVPS